MTEPYILFRDDKTGQTNAFVNPEEIICIRKKSEFFAALERMEQLRKSGKWLAGFLSYEAGHLFEQKLEHFAKDNQATPYLCFGVFDGPSHDHALNVPKQRLENETFLTDPKAVWDIRAYENAFDALHMHLRKGNCYQANLTFPVTARWNGDPVAAFWSLIERQPVKYGALVNLGGPILLSRSPELFFKVDRDGWIETHPMKGTAARGRTAEDDKAITDAMLGDEKTQAENRMIVDLLRNDISRISEVGSLSVPKLFDIETYPTVHQMVSHVRAKLLANMTLTDIFASLFPVVPSRARLKWRRWRSWPNLSQAQGISIAELLVRSLPMGQCCSMWRSEQSLSLRTAMPFSMLVVGSFLIQPLSPNMMRRS